MEITSEWLAPILTSLAAIIAAVFTCRWQMQTELRKILENYVSDKKYKAYYNAVNLFYTIMNENKQGKVQTSPISSDKFEVMLKVKQALFVYGSDEAFRAFTRFLCRSTNDQQQDYFTPFLDFMVIVRKEMSGGKSKITTDDIMLNLMQSHKELQKYHDFIKNIRKT